MPRLRKVQPLTQRLQPHPQRDGPGRDGLGGEPAAGEILTPVPGDMEIPGSAGSTVAVVPAGELEWRFSRSSGPGGQSVNTTDSRVELSWDLASSPTLSPVQRRRALERLAGRLVDGVLTVEASEHRSQLRNRAAAAERMQALVAQAIAPPPPPRRPTRPSKAAQERRIAEKKRRGETKRLRRTQD